MRLARDILIAVIAIGIFSTLSSGLRPVFPALAAVFRGLLNPFVLGSLLLAFILLKMGGLRRRNPVDDGTEPGEPR